MIKKLTQQELFPRRNSFDI